MKIISVIISLIMLTEISFGYISTIRINGMEFYSSTEEGNVVEIIPRIEVEGWNVKSGNTTVTDNKFIMPGSDVEIEGVLVGEGYTVTYNANGGSGAPVSQMATKGDSMILSSTEPVKEEYVFIGWSTDPNAEEAEYPAGGTFTGNENITLYAIWEEEILWNKPVLGTGLTPVNWNGSAWVETNESNWDYNYDMASAWSNSVGSSTYGVEGDGTAKWANAQTADGSIYVWIPRFTYYTVDGNKVSWNADTAGTAKTYILWSKGTDDYITDESGETAYTYNKHSAFTLTDASGNIREITGFWVGKYEASQGANNVPESKPEVAPWLSASVSDMYKYAKDLNGTDLETGAHLLKDNEWGAVALLTSAVGRIPYINNNATYSGYTGATQNATTSDTSYKWNTENGVRGSTTHNIYGVYDLNGGRDEYVSAYYSGGTTSYHSNLIASATKYGNKYVNKYEEAGPTGDNARLGWDSDYENELVAASPIPERSGHVSDTSNAGIFLYFYVDGAAKNYVTFRVGLFGENIEKRTITYNANGGSFDNGNINTVDYVNTTTTETKTSKTSNVSEDGSTYSGAYTNSASLTDVVTIPGAALLSVTITYQTQSTSYDWVCVYDGTITPSATNYSSSKSGKLGGTTKTTKTYTIFGDTVQFYFKSNASSNTYFGYYAVVTGDYDIPIISEGEYKNPTREGFIFKGWSDNASSTTAEYSVNGNNVPNENKSLYAVWKEKVVGLWNEPVIGPGLTPVNWDTFSSSWVEIDEANWDYNYDTASSWSNSVGSSSYGVEGDGTARWANAVTADGSIYVWIPRFSYYTYAGNSVSWNADTPGTARTYILWSDGTEDYTTDESGETAYTYKSHSAFNPGGRKITGFWVGKYPAGKGSDVPVSNPEAGHWQTGTMNEHFTYGKNLNPQAGSHMLKDSEWGAAALLTSAKGRMPYSNSSGLIGYAGETQNSTSSATRYFWNTEEGVRGSTTHNVYGIYDMSGGYWERTAAYYSGGSNGHITELQASYNAYGNKYVDVYTSVDPTVDSARLGWDSDWYEYPLEEDRPVPQRGGGYSTASGSGIFAFYSSDYNSLSTDRGFRIALFGFSW